MTVLDASAALAYLRGEPGGQEVADVLEAGGAVMSAANWAEVLSRLVAQDQPLELVLSRLYGLGIVGATLRIHPVEEDHAIDAARIHPLTRPAGLSLGDRLCLALARALSQPVLTADRSWAGIDGLGVEVRLIR
jgi:ribonuclease VapC